MNITIHSRESIEKLLKSGFSKNTAVISIYDSGIVGLNNDYKPVFFPVEIERVFQFPLVDIDIDELEEYEITCNTFFPEADELAGFIYSAIKDGFDIICQCEYGQSRSAACAAAILEHFENNGISIFSDYRYCPNKLVYHKLLGALNEHEKGKETILENSESIKCMAYFGRSNLKEVFISHNTKKIEDMAFLGCDNIKKIAVDSTNEAYDSRNNCNAIIETALNKLIAGCKNTIIPDGIKIIGNAAFSHCKNLEKIIVPEGVEKIEKLAFWGCNNLTEIMIPNSVAKIAQSAFAECEKLTINCYSGSYAEKYAKENGIKYKLIDYNKNR